jgi:hypothetical protein
MVTQHALANEPHEGLNFSIGVQNVAGCNTRSSDVSCTLPSGQPFVVEVSLDELPDDIHSYGGFDLYAEYTGVTPVDPLDASNDVWADCGFPAAAPGDGYIGWGCAMGLPPAQPSSWIGPIGTVSFTCTANGSISLVHKAGTKTDLVESVTEDNTGVQQSIIHAEGADTKETLTIACGTVPGGGNGTVTEGTPGPVGPTPGQAHEGTGSGNQTPAPGQTPGEEGPTLEPTAAALATLAAQEGATATAAAGGTPTDEGPDEEDDDDSSYTWIWITLGIIAVIVVIAGGAYLWYRRREGGGSTPPPSSGTPPASGGTPPAGGGGTPTSGGTPPSGGGGTAT